MTVKLKAGVVADVPVSSLKPDPRQPRKGFSQEGLQSLADSMAAGGVEIELRVRYEGKQLIIVDGERRWRAAKLAKLKTVPCLLADKAEPLDVAATQLTTSIQREELSPLDIAEFVADLVKRQKASQNEVLAALAKRGIKEIGAARLDRYLKLLELPEWAKAWLRDGTMTEAHGQALLPAVKAPKVLQFLKSELPRQISYAGALTAGGIRSSVESGFRRHTHDLNARHMPDKDTRHFSIDICRKCPLGAYQKVGGVEYCLDRDHFDQLNGEAMLLRADREARRKAKEQSKPEAKTPAAQETDPTKVEPRKVKSSRENIVVLKGMQRGFHISLVGAQFDTAGCKGCPHNHIASSDGNSIEAAATCFHPPCYQEKARLDQRQAGRRGKLREYFEEWLRPVVKRVAPQRLDPNEVYGLALWLATGAIDERTKYYAMHQADDGARETLPWLDARKLANLPDLVTFAREKLADKDWRELVAAAVEVLTRKQLFWLAQHVKVELTDPDTLYRVDAAYLRLKRKAELQELLRGALKGEAAEGVGEFTTEGLRDLATAQREAIGVPADIEAVYRTPVDERAGEDSYLLEEEEGEVCIACGCTQTDACDGGCSWRHRDPDLRVGLCDAPDCAGQVERWKSGDRTLSPAARERCKERQAMTRDEELTGALTGADLDCQEEE